MKLKDLAQELGLSLTTVSRALNGYSEVKESTRLRVTAAAQRRGYMPNPAAKRLALGRSGYVGLVYPFGPNDLGDPSFLTVISGLRAVLEANHYELLLISEAPDDPIQSYRRVMSSGLVDGLIVARTQRHDPRLALLQEHGLPFVAHGRSELSAPYPWLDYDNELGGRLAAERLLSLGHRRIALLSADLGLTFAWQRRAGFMSALQAAQVSPQPQYLREGVFDRRSGYQAMGSLLELPTPPTAVLVDNNLSAIGVLRQIEERKLVLGRDISVIIYDALPPDTLQSKHITIVQQPDLLGAGRALAELMLRRLQGESPEQLHTLLQPLLVDGPSDGPVFSLCS